MKMEAILIKPKDSAELNFVSELLEKLKIRSNVLNLEEFEDIALGELMSASDRNEKVSRSEIMKKLGKN